MQINANFSERAAIHAATMPWTASPMPGVARRMLDRLGGEIARATSIVRYAPQSLFSPHVHTGGEEFFVLDGAFRDEHGDFLAGSYIRNPRSRGTRRVRRKAARSLSNSGSSTWPIAGTSPSMRMTAPIRRPRTDAASLSQDARETVRLERWQAGTLLALDAPDGLETLVLDGSFIEGGETFKWMSWLRLPRQGAARALAKPERTRVWIKEGHLAVPPEAPAVS